MPKYTISKATNVIPYHEVFSIRANGFKQAFLVGVPCYTPRGKIKKVAPNGVFSLLLLADAMSADSGKYISKSGVTNITQEALSMRLGNYNSYIHDCQGNITTKITSKKHQTDNISKRFMHYWLAKSDAKGDFTFVANPGTGTFDHLKKQFEQEDVNSQILAKYNLNSSSKSAKNVAIYCTSKATFQNPKPAEFLSSNANLVLKNKFAESEKVEIDLAPDAFCEEGVTAVTNDIIEYFPQFFTSKRKIISSPHRVAEAKQKKPKPSPKSKAHTQPQLPSATDSSKHSLFNKPKFVDVTMQELAPLDVLANANDALYLQGDLPYGNGELDFIFQADDFAYTEKTSQPHDVRAGNASTLFHQPLMTVQELEAMLKYDEELRNRFDK